MTALETDKTTLQSQVSNLQSEITTLENRVTRSYNDGFDDGEAEGYQKGVIDGAGCTHFGSFCEVFPERCLNLFETRCNRAVDH